MTAFLKGKIIILFWFWKERVLGAFFKIVFLKKVIFDRYILPCKKTIKYFKNKKTEYYFC